MTMISRRRFLQATAGGALAAAWSSAAPAPSAPLPGERPSQDPSVKVILPKGRVPVSFIIDDSTCLVNLAHFAIPQFAEVFPDRYLQPWRSLPREIPDSFVRKFAEWCHAHGVKGKYSIVPFPACVGWVDHFMPGWSRRELEASLDLVRTAIVPDWDIHPEMVSHTWVIDTRTGQPYRERSDRFMENWRWTDGRSVDEIAHYIAYALKPLKNVGLVCEGMTTPGGFGNRVLAELSQATLEACRDVYRTEIPHYFRHLYTDERSVAPRVEYAAGLAGPDPRCVVSIIGCTGDWFGGWDGLTPGSVEQFITADLKRGRLVDVIARGEPAILVCHWPGIYYNGLEIGFNIFKEIVRRLDARYDNLVWMKLSEIARYWAAKELTAIRRQAERIELSAPFAAPAFTLEIPANTDKPPRLVAKERSESLRPVSERRKLEPGTACKQGQQWIVCFDLPKGRSALTT